MSTFIGQIKLYSNMLFLLLQTLMYYNDWSESFKTISLLNINITNTYISMQGQLFKIIPFCNYNCDDQFHLHLVDSRNKRITS